MKKSVEHLLTSVFDYTGLISGNEDDLRSALRDFVEFSGSKEKEMLSRFVIPHNLIPSLSTFADRKHQLKGPLSLCITAPRTETLKEFKNVVRDIEEEILSVHSDYPGEVRTNILELKLPEVSVINVDPEELVRALESVVITAAASRLLPHRVYFELPSGQKNVEVAKKITKVIAVHNKSILKRKIDNYLFSGLKINCVDHSSGEVADAEYLAEVMLYARDANVALKFSGAENTPFPSYDYKANREIHGFMNVLIASMLAYTQDLNVKETVQVIEDKTPENFTFKDDYLAWRELAAPSMEIKMLRMLSITSFNISNLPKIRDDLKEFKLI
jgi:hypothetical protein